MLGACATVAGTPSSYGPLVARHREKALKLERSGDLRRALDEWQIALTLEPHNAAAREGQARLEARLQRALASRLRQGQEALRRGEQLEARRNFLAALALDPGNKVAFETLRDRVKEIHFVSHTVARGETLASIADRYYGDRLRSEVIWEMNQLSSRPKAGSQLKIPEIPGVPFRTAAPQRTAAARRLEPTRPRCWASRGRRRSSSITARAFASTGRSSWRPRSPSGRRCSSTTPSTSTPRTTSTMQNGSSGRCRSGSGNSRQGDGRGRPALPDTIGSACGYAPPGVMTVLTPLPAAACAKAAVMRGSGKRAVTSSSTPRVRTAGSAHRTA